MDIITKPITIGKNCFSLPLINKFAPLTACSPKQFNTYNDSEIKRRNSEPIHNYNCSERRINMPPEEISPTTTTTNNNHFSDCDNGGNSKIIIIENEENPPKNNNNTNTALQQQQQHQQAVAAQSKKSRKRRRRNRKKRKTTTTNCCLLLGNNICNKPKLKERTISTSSDDSFIVFESNDDDNDEGVDGMDEGDGGSCSLTITPKTLSLSSSSSSTVSDDDDEEDGQNDKNNCLMTRSTLPRKKVHFATEEDLCKVHPMITWSFAYQAARKGPWEQYGRDRDRFNKRIRNIETILNPILTSEHRFNIYQQRFLQDN